MTWTGMFCSLAKASASARWVRAKLGESAITASIFSPITRYADHARKAESTPPEYAISVFPSDCSLFSNIERLSARLAIQVLYRRLADRGLGASQKRRSCRRRLPNAPTLARLKAKRNWFSFLTEPSANRRYSTLNPQQSQLYVVCTVPYCRNPRLLSKPKLDAPEKPRLL